MRTRSALHMTRAAVAALTLGLMMFGTAPVRAAGVYDSLLGVWNGWGMITLNGGSKERVRCRITYAPDGSDARLRQEMRCASTSQKIDAGSTFIFSGPRVSGTWIERGYASAGTITGRATNQTISLDLKGDGFGADIGIKVAGCNLSVNIQPTGVSVTNISLNLTKC